MKELKCISCGKIWYINEANEKEVRYCPYCATGIWETADSSSYLTGLNSRYFAFHKTVRGYQHTIRDMPCKSHSVAYMDSGPAGEGQFYIAVVAEGNDDAACMRSRLGSQKAAEIAKECLTRLAESVMSEEQDSLDEKNPDRYKSFRSLREMLANAALHGKDKDAGDTLKARVPASLTNTIISRWYAFVEDDIRRNPISEEEIAQAGQYADTYREGRRLAHVYGTTLIAALMLPDYLLLIQQGNGRCDVFYEDGTVDQPIPWDATTSMCDEDAAVSIRSRVIDLREKKVIACFLGGDGVEDAYHDMEGIRMFCRDLICELVDRGEDAFEAYLDEMLPGFSQTGSGDDVSVSGIVDMERVKDFVPSFRMQNEQYNQNQLKVAIAKYNEMEGMYKEAVAKADQWKQQWTKWENELEQLKKVRRKSSVDIIPSFFGKRSNSGFLKPQEYEDHCIKKIKEREYSLKKYYPEYIKVCEEEENLYDKMCEQKRKVSSLEQSLKNAKRQFQKAQQEFAGG